MLASPRRHFLASNIFITESLKPFFYKHVLAIVIGVFCENVTSTGPWRNDGEWETET